MFDWKWVARCLLCREWTVSAFQVCVKCDPNYISWPELLRMNKLISLKGWEKIV